ncbi:hypothetical protein TWF730_004375 [Orbilia blumenaviensis]|uniref:Uncharacterized protein n=1 Tax=Orbilia blumenaviensis TaxID=1796055 RepID=A0AAV9TXZ0_9PEZI
MRATFSSALIALAAIEAALAVQPMGGRMVLAKRQAVCVGPVVCEQSATSCTSCEAGFYCAAGGGCCEDGQVCAGFKPCVNAGSSVRDAELTQVCPTDAPICTASDLIPVCSGNLQDWATISAALGGDAQTTEIDTPTFTTPSFIASATSTEFEPELTSSSEFEVETSTSFEESITSEPTSSFETTAAPESTDASVTRGAGRSSSSTSTSAPSSTPNSGTKMQFSLGLAASLILTSLLL